MNKIALYIELKDGQIKPANFGMISAASKNQETELYAIILSGEADEHQDVLEEHGVQKIVHIPTDKIQKQGHPELYAALIMEVMHHFGIHILLGLTTPHGKDLLPRIAAALGASHLKASAAVTEPGPKPL